MPNEFLKPLKQAISSHRKMLQNIFTDKDTPLHYRADGDLFLLYFNRMTALTENTRAAQNYLNDRKFSTYGDMLEFHQRVMGHLLTSNPESRGKLEVNLIYSSASPSSEPEFYGPSRMFLNTLDLMVAIPYIPHSPNPEQPTILGLMLSSTQAVLRDERLFFARVSHHDMMHLLVMQGAFFSAFAKTTTGEPVFRSHPDIDLSQAKPGNLLFEDITISNAVFFHPECILLTAHPRFQTNEQQNAEPPIKVFYNPFDPGKSLFLPSPGEDVQQSPSLVLSNNFSPDFMRTMRSILS